MTLHARVPWRAMEAVRLCKVPSISPYLARESALEGPGSGIGVQGLLRRPSQPPHLALAERLAERLAEGLAERTCGNLCKKSGLEGRFCVKVLLKTARKRLFPGNLYIFSALGDRFCVKVLSSSGDRDGNMPWSPLRGRLCSLTLSEFGLFG